MSVPLYSERSDKPLYSERSDKLTMGELFRDLFHKISDYNKAQFRLVQAQIKAESQKLGFVMLYGFAALGIGVVMLWFLGITMLLLLSTVVELPWAAMITTGIFMVLAGIAVAMTLAALKKDSAAIDIHKIN